MINRYILPLAPLLACASLAFAEDSIILKNGNSLTGKLITSDSSGILTLEYPNAKKPIQIKETAVERIVFDPANHKNSSLTERIQLLNGDHFPCTITSLNDELVSFNSDSVGNHTVSRNLISQIKFNTKANRVLYSGPGNDLSAWTTSSEDWKLSNGKLHSLEISDASIAIPNLTENYILEFKTAWEEASPKLNICFSSDRSEADKKSDFYYITLNSHGVSVYRSKLGRYETLTQVLGSENIYNQSNIHVAIHVDRKNQKMALYLNGNRVRTIIDTKTPPTGSYLVVKNLQRTGVLTEVSDIKISSWSGKVTDDIKSKSNTLAKHDLITDLTGNIMTGKIISLSRSKNNTSLNFKAPFAKKESIIPAKALDLLEFKTTTSPTDISSPTYHLNLISGGLISYTDSQMKDDKLTISHPILGKVSIPRSNLSSAIIIPEPPKEAPAKEQ